MKVKLTVVGMLMLVSAAATAFNTTNIPEVDGYIYNLNTKAHWNFSNVRVVQTTKADLNNDGIPEVVVLYVTQGAAWQMINLAVFNQQNNKFVLVDDVQLRAAESSRFDVIKGVITMDLTQWGENDPHCCPTVHTKARFVLRHDKIVDY